MNTYLAKLKAAEFARKRHSDAPSKPSELGIEGFEGASSRHFPEKEPAAHLCSVIAVAVKNATSGHPQNPRNVDPAAEAEAWRDRYEERCGILEFDHGLSRARAEHVAFQNIVVEWMDAHPEPSQAGWCAHCGQAEATTNLVVPFGVEPERYAWLHLGCSRAWHGARRTKAVAALLAMGVIRPADGSN